MDRFIADCKEAIPFEKHRDIFSTRKRGIQITPEEQGELVELFKQKFSGGGTICQIVHEIIQNLAFTVLLFE